MKVGHAFLLTLVAGMLSFGGATTCLGQDDASGTAQKTAALTNADVIQMLKSGFSDTAVVAVIQKGKTKFDVSKTGIAELRYAGVPSSVIVAMVEATDAETPAAEAPPAPPAPPAPAPQPAAQPAPPAPRPAAVQPAPYTPPPPTRRYEEDEEEDEETRRGGVFGIELGGQYMFDLSSDSDADGVFGGVLGLQAGGHAGRKLSILADLNLGFFESPDSYSSGDAGALFMLGPAFRIAAAPRFSVELGLSLAMGVPDLADEDSDLFVGPAAHVGIGIELTPGKSNFALEFQARFDGALIKSTDCSDCDYDKTGRFTTGFGFTWY